MNPFLQKMLAAAGLVRQGHLRDATRAIQQALHGDEASAAVVAERPPAAFAPPVSPPAGPGRFDASSFTNASGTRGFKLFDPDAISAPLPLVVMLHGCTQDADDFAAGTQMNALARERGFLVLYPEQAPRSNAQRCWNWFVPGDQHRGAGEPALLAGMTRHVMATHRVDPDRVYVAGLSAGGAMAAILAREYPDLFAAAGIQSGLPPGAAHDVASAFVVMQSGAAPPQAAVGAATATPWHVPSAPSSVSPLAAAPAAHADAAGGAPLIVFHGDADATVNVLNGSRLIDAAMGNEDWQAGHEAESAGATAATRRFTRTVYRDADAPAASPSRAEHWVVHGAAHAWSGGDASGSFTDPAGPDASREMLRFFTEHPRPGGTAAAPP